MGALLFLFFLSIVSVLREPRNLILCKSNEEKEQSKDVGWVDRFIAPVRLTFVKVTAAAAAQQDGELAGGVSSTPRRILRGDGISAVGKRGRPPYENSEQRVLAAMADEESHAVTDGSSLSRGGARYFPSRPTSREAGFPSRKLLAFSEVDEVPGLPHDRGKVPALDNERSLDLAAAYSSSSTAGSQEDGVTSEKLRHFLGSPGVLNGLVKTGRKLLAGSGKGEDLETLGAEGLGSSLRRVPGLGSKLQVRRWFPKLAASETVTRGGGGRPFARKLLAPAKSKVFMKIYGANKRISSNDDYVWRTPKNSTCLWVPVPTREPYKSSEEFQAAMDARGEFLWTPAPPPPPAFKWYSRSLPWEDGQKPIEEMTAKHLQAAAAELEADHKTSRSFSHSLVWVCYRDDATKAMIESSLLVDNGGSSNGVELVEGEASSSSSSSSSDGVQGEASSSSSSDAVQGEASVEVFEGEIVNAIQSFLINSGRSSSSNADPTLPLASSTTHALALAGAPLAFTGAPLFLPILGEVMVALLFLFFLYAALVLRRGWWRGREGSFLSE